MSSGFKQPENFDEVASQEDWSMWAGGNDWESGITWIAVRFGGKWRGERLWIEVNHENPDDDQSTAEQEKIKKFGEKAWKTWVKVAKRIKMQDGIYNYEKAFEEALKDSEMKPFIKQSGKDQQTWASVQERAAIVAAKLLEDENVTFRTPIVSMDLDFDPDSTATASGTVVWTLDTDVRDWGIKEFNIHVKAINAFVDYSDYADGTDEEVERQMEIVYPEPDAPFVKGDPKDMVMSHPHGPKWSAEVGFDQGSPGVDRGLRPRMLVIEVRKKRITVLF